MYVLLVTIATLLGFSSFSSAAAFASLGPANQIGTKRASMPLLHRMPSRPHLMVPRGGDQKVEDLDVDEPLVEEPSTEAEAEAEPVAKVASTKVVAAPCVISKVMATLTSVGACYSKQLESRPILTKSYTAGLIFGLSDYFAQKIESSNDVNGSSSSMNWTRVITSTLVGLLYFGPAAHYWYEWIFKLLPGTTLASTLYKAFWGQVLFGPSFTCVFFATILMQSGNFSLQSWWQKIRSDLPGAWLAGAGYWPIVDLLSYSIVPVKWIPLFVNMASFIWTIYLSLVANKKSSSA
ncbi:unnamed protein product [Pseudo-nitzschia multistriata]|uniref:Peroxisomal membrane protein MPV17 n=1 Tax=Pseudo-nitzschia multistriata TaxID=183589 RepID=A0A448ZES3_9STRA|nr:unnamed protein product [Pseudo-nitzschia multistriata]